MRRTVSSLVIVLVIGLIGAPAWAKRYDHIRLPESIELGERMKLKVYDCQSGLGYDARVRVRIEDEDGNRVLTRNVDADDDGTTKVKIRIGDTKFAPGVYTITVWCIHRFDGGGTGTLFSETVEFTVV